MPDPLTADTTGLAAPWFPWPQHRHIHVLARDIRRRDAVGNFCFDLAALFRGAGIRTALYAENYDAADPAGIRPIGEAIRGVAPDDLIFFNFSTEDRMLPELTALPCRKILYYHGITPPRLLVGSDPRSAEYVRRGYAQLPLAAKFDVAMANSRASAGTLRAAALTPTPAIDDIIIAPPVLGLRRWDRLAAEPAALPETRRLLLFVGRLLPHKAIVPLLHMFRALVTLDPSWGLALIGSSADKDYRRLVDDCLAEHRTAFEGRVALLHEISDGALKSAYQRADLFVTLSEHEGFCVPLVEAMSFDLPIVVRDEPAMAEVLGDAGLLLSETKPEEIAGAIKRLMDDSDSDALARLADRRPRRFAELCELAGGVPIWRALEKALSLDARTL